MSRPTDITIPSTRGTGITVPTRNGKPQRSCDPAPDETPHTVDASDSDKIPGRNFIIAYRGQFIGHYHYPKKISTKHAFARIAEQVRQQIGEEFEIRHLELFKPVRLRRPPELGTALEAGKLEWFGGEEEAV